MKTFIVLSTIALFTLSSNTKEESKVEITKSFKNLNIHDTTDAKILLA